MRFCFILGWVALAFCGAAELPDPAAPPARISSVVRADRRNGRLVRSIAVSPRPAPNASVAGAPAAVSLDPYVRQTAERYQVDPLLVHSVIQVESNYNPLAISPKGALGLMQLMPATARRFAVRNSFNPAENIDGGVRYLKYLLTLFEKQQSPERLALAAYNAGEGAVLRHGGIPPFRETTAYVDQVVNQWAAKRAAAPRPAQQAASPRIVQFFDSRGVLHIQTLYEP
jgi:soluble lytic murein transglycosylase-like protein